MEASDEEVKRPKGWIRNTDRGIEVSYAVMFPDVCLQGEEDTLAGRLERGTFFPASPEAECYFDKQQSFHQSQKKERLPPHVYFIQVEDDGPVKIGHAFCVASRLAALQTANPNRLVLRKVLDHSGREMERRLHEQFAHCRLNGEWFKPTPDLERFLDEA